MNETDKKMKEAQERHLRKKMQNPVIGEEDSNKESEMIRKKKEVEEANVAMLRGMIRRVYRSMAEIGLPPKIQDKLWEADDYVRGLLAYYTGILRNPLTNQLVWVEKVRIDLKVSDKGILEACLNGLSASSFFERFEE